MKRKYLLRLLTMLLIATLLMTSAYAMNTDGIAAFADSYQSADIPIGSSNEVLMVGEVQQTIMSVTMPTYVPFDIARSVQGDNKAISPRITFTNNSNIPVALDVVYTAVDLSKLQGTEWSNDGNVAENQIAIGFQTESVENQMPTSLSGTKWLQANSSQNINIAYMGALESSVAYVVGTLGNAVPENNTFTVTPTLVVRQA